MNSKPADPDPERWARVEQLFDEVADMTPPDRTAHLANACGADENLRSYIESLARSDMAKDSLIRDSIRGLLKSAIPETHSITDVVGERIGPYRLVRVIGSGGMGVVYLAERADEQFRQQVAIKLVRQRLIYPEIAERLVGERQILANLHHPHIARLFDGGTTSDGTPYLVMEYIDGVPIDDYCDGRRLNINERLALFRTICSAVHYAHQNLIVHRDIKPTNILVTEDGVPKLLDFGIAKLLGAGGAAIDGLTRDGAVMMTPENATPEQVLNGPITTATDTYALGVLLYRLLTGHPPYEIGDSPREMALAICEQAPQRPSVVVGREALAPLSSHGNRDIVSPHLISRYRSTTTEKLKRRLKGDLDNIVLYALRKEPARRYGSVNEFAEDIRMHLASLPVLARPDTWGYRSGKFVHRHVVGVAMSGILVTLLAAFGATMTVQNKRITEERDTAKEVSTFLEEIFRAPDPGNARGLDITAKEILSMGAKNIRTQLEDRPAIQATLMEAMGRVYFNLGEYKPSIEMLEESLSLRRQSLGDGHPDVAASKNALAASLIRTADYERARSLLEEALEVNRREHGESSAAVASTMFNFAELLQATGELDGAQTFATASIDIYTPQSDRYAVELAEAKNALARILRGKNDLDEAERLQREAIALVERRLGKNHPFIAYYLQNLAVVLQAQGELDAAEAMFYESIAVTRKVLGEKHDLLGTSLVTLGTLLHNKGEYDDAERAFRDALAVHEGARGAEHPFVAYDMTSLAMLLHDKGDLDEAESLLRDALRIYEESVGPDHQYVASTLTELGAVLTEKGLPEDAELILLRAVEIRTQDYPPMHPLVAATNTVYGHALAGLGRYDDAERLLIDNLPYLTPATGGADRRSRRALAWTVSLYEDWGKPEEADRYRQQVLPSKPMASTE
jgi:serine/threonine protein kinase/tetratricopeptide (TPR) repeat protein